MFRKLVFASALVAAALTFSLTTFRAPSQAERKLGELGKELVDNGSYVWSTARGRPVNKRSRPYQNLEGIQGDRTMEERYPVMQLPEDMAGKTVLDLGCNLGRICLDSARRGAARVVGVDFSPRMIETARKYAKMRHEEYGEPTDKIEFYVADLNQGLDDLMAEIGAEKFDYVFCLSIWGVVEHEAVFDIVNYYTNDTCWFEGHNIGGKYGDQSSDFIAQELDQQTHAQQVNFLGYTTDDKGRSRANFKLKFS